MLPLLNCPNKVFGLTQVTFPETSEIIIKPSPPPVILALVTALSAKSSVAIVPSAILSDVMASAPTLALVTAPSAILLVIIPPSLI